MKTLDNGLFPALNVNISFRSVKSLVFKQDGNNFPPSFKYLRRTLESSSFPYGRPSSLQMYRVYPGDEYQIYLGGRDGGWSLPPTAMSPGAHPLSTFETNMAVRNGKRTMSTILRKKNIGTVVSLFFLRKRRNGRTKSEGTGAKGNTFTPRANDGHLWGSFNLWVCGWNPIVLPFKWNLFNSSFTWYNLFTK